MNNNTFNSSNFTRGVKNMNLRFWGGWFLAIACISIFLTMGCEKGSLGVKFATVFGRVVNKDNVAMGVPNATVRMVSKETVSGGGGLEQGYNFLSTVTDAEGYFVFEKVQPDNVIFEFSAPGYKKVVYPQSSSSDEEDSGDSADIESVTIANGASVDIRNILMEKVSQTIPSTINVKIDFIDKNSKKPVDDNVMFAVTFDGISYTDARKAKWWRDTGIQDVLGANEIAVGIRDESNTVLYNPASMTISGLMDQYVSIEVEPVTYTISCQFLNVPQYLISSTKCEPKLSFLVEDISDGLPIQNISITEVKDFSQLAVLEIPAMRNPQRIRIRMQGYRDEIILLNDIVSDGQKGSYRFDIDFQYDDDKSGDDPVSLATNYGVIGMLDNVIRTDIKVNIIGLAQNDQTKIYPNFTPKGGIIWEHPYGDGFGLADALGMANVTLKSSPTYFDMTYSVFVQPTNPASDSYIISSKDVSFAIYVPEQNETEQVVVIDASKMTSSSTNN